MPCNILFLNQTSQLSGAEKSLLVLLENLNRNLFSPLLVLPDEGPFSKLAAAKGIPVSLLPGMIQFGEKHSPEKLPRYLLSLFRLHRMIRSYDIKLVHSNSPRAAFLGGAAARLSGVASVVHVRDIHQNPFTYSRRGWLLERWTDGLIAVSRATLETVLSHRPAMASRSKVVYNGVPLITESGHPSEKLRTEFKIPSGAPVVGCVGIIHPAKGQDVLIQAAALIRREFPGLKVLIVGKVFSSENEEYLRKIKNLVKKLDLEDNVIFTGFRNDIHAIINLMDAVVHPARYPEPFPRVVLEAGALGKPVGAAKVGGVPELIENGVTGVLFPPNDRIAMAAAVESVLKNTDKSFRMGRALRKKIENKFTVERHVDSIERIYEYLVKIQ
jgi:L-malate glycosyltransferase